jgi:hypothetical protein
MLFNSWFIWGLVEVGISIFYFIIIIVWQQCFKVEAPTSDTHKRDV